MAYRRVPIVGIMGSGQEGPHDAMAKQLGELVARRGYVLLTGGGRGVMAAASQGAAEAGGLVVGILPSATPDDPRYPGYPNGYVHIPIYTGLSDGRNAVNVNSSDVVVCFPGGAGTLSELALALKRGKPVIVVDWDEFTLPATCPLHLVRKVADATEALAAIAALLPEAG